MLYIGKFIHKVLVYFDDPDYGGIISNLIEKKGILKVLIEFVN